MFSQDQYYLDDTHSLNISNHRTAQQLQDALILSKPFHNQVWASNTPLYTGTEDLPEHLRMVHAISCPNFTGSGLPFHIHTLEVTDSDTFTGEELPDYLSAWEKFLGKRRGLRRLRINNCPNFSGRNLPLSLEELQISGFTGTVLKVHRRVRIISVDNAPHLREVERDDTPFGLKTRGPFGLTVSGVEGAYCPNFEGTHLPRNLTRLEVYSSDRFTGEYIPASVKKLIVRNAPLFKKEHLRPRDAYDRLIID